MAPLSSTITVVRRQPAPGTELPGVAKLAGVTAEFDDQIATWLTTGARHRFQHPLLLFEHLKLRFSLVAIVFNLPLQKEVLLKQSASCSSSINNSIV